MNRLPELRKTNGRLVLIGSGASIVPFPGYVIYTASKYAVRAIGQTLALELHGSGVSCTNIYPGLVDTELVLVDNQGKFNPERKKPKRLNMWSAEKAAKVCVNAIYHRKREYIFTAMGKTMGWFGHHMPGIYHFVLTRIGSEKIMSYED